MARARRRDRVPSGLTDVLILDADGVSKSASHDRAVQAWLERAWELDADLVVSAITVTEVTRGSARDAGTNWMLKAIDIRDVTEPLARQAGKLLGQAKSDDTVDAVVAATALGELESRSSRARCVLLTSDPVDLTTLVGDDKRIQVVAI